MTLVKAMTSGFPKSQRAGFWQQKTSALGKPDVDLFISRTDRHAIDRHDLPPSNQGRSDGGISVYIPPK